MAKKQHRGGLIVRIGTDGTEYRLPIDPAQVDNEGMPPLDVLQRQVGGASTPAYVEMVWVTYQGAQRRAFVDEDGRMKGLPFNPYATRMTTNQHRIVGHMAIWVPRD